MKLCNFYLVFATVDSADFAILFNTHAHATRAHTQMQMYTRYVVAVF